MPIKCLQIAGKIVIAFSCSKCRNKKSCLAYTYAHYIYYVGVHVCRSHAMHRKLNTYFSFSSNPMPKQNPCPINTIEVSPPIPPPDS